MVVKRESFVLTTVRVYNDDAFVKVFKVSNWKV